MRHRSRLSRNLLQWVFRLNVLSFVWLQYWKLWSSTVDDMHTYSLKAFHVGAHAACNMTVNTQLRLCSRPRVNAHVLLDFGCIYLRLDRNGLSVATHMDGKTSNQDRSHRSRWFTVWPREVYHLGSSNIATDKEQPETWLFSPSVVGLPAVQNSFLCGVGHVDRIGADCHPRYAGNRRLRPALGQPHPCTSFANDCRWQSLSCLNRPILRLWLPSQSLTQLFSGFVSWSEIAERACQ